MQTLKSLIAAAVLSTGLSQIGATSEPVVVEKNQAVIQVNGVVCSFCAYGTEKNLSKLSFLDQSYFDGDGVLLDINTHRITLALDARKLVDYAAINKAILDGGYDPVAIYVRVHGAVSKINGETILTCQTNGQTYRLQGPAAALLKAGQDVFVQGELLASALSDQGESDAVPMQVSLIDKLK